jgi:hypothetical protein
VVRVLSAYGLWAHVSFFLSCDHLSVGSGAQGQVQVAHNASWFLAAEVPAKSGWARAGVGADLNLSFLSTINFGEDEEAIP